VPAAKVGVLLVVAGALLPGLAGCVNLSYPPGASRDAGGEFVPHLQNGAACAGNPECQSGFCSDGFCCSEKCDAACYTCGKAGSEGRCTLADVGTDPHGSCVDQKMVAPCGQNGLCDGAGACQTYPVGTLCADARCQVQNVMLASRCTADGVCMPGTTQTCFPFLCDASGTKCSTSCTLPIDCGNGATCTNGVCGAKARGTACADGTECVTGFCAQGVCCSEACTDLCHSCALKGNEGACTLVPAGTPPPPPQSCPLSDPTMCGTDGTCDGAGACRLFVAGTACSASSCSSATLHPSSTCDGKMHCQTNSVVTCGGYTCGSPTACRTSCAADADCASPSVCGQSSCGGLAAQYFRQTNLSDLAFARTDPAINFNWGGGSPSPLLNVDNFSIRWRGKITARFSEMYTFYAATDDGERLFVGGVLVIDHFIRHSTIPEDTTQPIQMTAGKPVDIVFEYFENGGDASAVLSWSSDKSEPKAVIPTSALAPQ
jgi:PA14 domain